MPLLCCLIVLSIISFITIKKNVGDRMQSCLTSVSIDRDPILLLHELSDTWSSHTYFWWVYNVVICLIMLSDISYFLSTFKILFLVFESKALSKSMNIIYMLVKYSMLCSTMIRNVSIWSIHNLLLQKPTCSLRSRLSIECLVLFCIIQFNTFLGIESSVILFQFSYLMLSPLFNVYQYSFLLRPAQCPSSIPSWITCIVRLLFSTPEHLSWDINSQYFTKL